MKVKVCKRCGESLCISSFSRDATQKDGLFYYCKDCNRKRAREYYHRNKLKMNEKHKVWRKDNMDIVRESARKYRMRKMLTPSGRKELKARDTFQYQVRIGNIERESCVVCGDDKSVGHHEDYRLPLEVIWLCEQHHKDRHAEINKHRRASNE
ncbi:hypothetical protein N9104_01695 [Pseudomonadales bacterium]|nr:hypothetical protein [Pseudomonadales bacterium]